jgi:hypothetical protein
MKLITKVERFADSPAEGIIVRASEHPVPGKIISLSHEESRPLMQKGSSRVVVMRLRCRRFDPDRDRVIGTTHGLLSHDRGIQSRLETRADVRDYLGRGDGGRLRAGGQVEPPG